MNVAITKLKSRVIKRLKAKGPQKFSQLTRGLRVRDEKRLDNVLQELRRGGQIHYTGHVNGWTTGRGPVFTPNQRFVI